MAVIWSTCFEVLYARSVARSTLGLRWKAMFSASGRVRRAAGWHGCGWAGALARPRVGRMSPGLTPGADGAGAFVGTPGWVVFCCANATPGRREATTLRMVALFIVSFLSIHG